MVTEKKNTMSKIITSLLILYPLLSLYHPFGLPVSLPDSLMILLLIFVVIKSCLIGSVTLETAFLPWTVYIILHMISTLIFRNVSDSHDFIGSTFRYLLFFIAILFSIRNYFDIEYGIKIYKYVCIISTAFLIIQIIVLAIFGYYIKGVLNISFLPVTRADLPEFGNDISQYTLSFRPRSFFGEPAHYGTYICGYLAISLFKNGKKELPVQLFLSLGALLSLSSTAIIMIIGIWFMYFVSNFSRKVSLRTLLTVLCIPIILFFVIKSDFFKQFLYRLTETESTENRFYEYKNLTRYFEGKTSLFLFGFGNGGTPLSNEKYFAGYARLFLYYGLTGIVVFASNMLSVFLKGRKWQKMLLIVVLALQIGGESFLSNMILCQLPFVCSIDQNTDTVQKQKNQYIREIRHNRCAQ